MAPVEINLGDSDNPEIEVHDDLKIRFTNTTNVEITLSTKGLLPREDKNYKLAQTRTRNGYRIPGKYKGKKLAYKWSNTNNPRVRTRSGTIRVT